MLVSLLDAEGYLGSFDFLYIPMDFRRGLSLGYAFLNFDSPSIAAGFHRHFTGGGGEGGRRRGKKEGLEGAVARAI